LEEILAMLEIERQKKNISRKQQTARQTKRVVLRKESNNGKYNRS
jgi:hypothetical protein